MPTHTQRFAPRPTKAGDKPGHYPERQSTVAVPEKVYHKPNRYDNAYPVGIAIDDPTRVVYSKAETANRTTLYGTFSKLRPKIQPMSARLGSKTRYAMRFKWQS